ncbi:MAG: flagellin [Burkholderiales bacterium]|jgi:flagellin|nr:flagellin [Burkholderiales bacterium]
MPQVINTNIASLNTQRTLNSSQSMQAQALQRLSSGLRINSAKDDAAGLAISERFTSQIRGLNQATRNAQDAISLSQTAEGALGEVSNNLQRIRELAVQAANGTNSASDRAALNNEVQQRLAEVDRIASQTSFNGLRVLDGTYGTQQFQVGANAGETISVALNQGVRSNQLGRVATSTTVVNADTYAGGSITVGSNAAVTVNASVDNSSGTGNAGRTADSAYSKALAVNNAGVGGLTATATNNIEFTVAAVASGGAADGYSLVINGTNIFNATDVSVAGGISAQGVLNAINAQTANTGVTASLDGTNLRLSAADGRNISIGQTLGADATGGLTAGAGGSTTVNGVEFRDGTLAAFASPSVNRGTISFTATESLTFTGNADDFGLGAATTNVALDSTTLNNIGVTSISAANDAIARVDAALTTVNTVRATLGAVQSRFEATISNLQTSSENLSASRSRIQDADFAEETAKLTRAQILQQAGVAMLAQANALPQNVLALLRG